jgi:hypothetical protein
MKHQNFGGAHNLRGKGPLTPKWGTRNFRVVRGLSAEERSSRIEECGEAAVPIQVGPSSAETDENPAAADADFGGHFDQQAAPRVGLAFAQWIGLTTAVEIAAPGGTLQRFDRHRLVINRTERWGLQGRRRCESTA